MKQYNLTAIKANCIKIAAEKNDATVRAISEFKEGKITLKKLWKRGTFEKTRFHIGIYAIMNCNGIDRKNITCGKLVKINGNFDYITSPDISYRGDSVEECLRMKYLKSDGKYVIINRTLNKCKWSDEDIEDVINLEYIGILAQSTTYRNKLKSLFIMLEDRYPGLNLIEQMQFAREEYYNDPA